MQACHRRLLQACNWADYFKFVIEQVAASFSTEQVTARLLLDNGQATANLSLFTFFNDYYFQAYSANQIFILINLIETSMIFRVLLRKSLVF